MPPGKKLTLFAAMNAFQATPARVSSLNFFCVAEGGRMETGFTLKLFDRAGQNDSPATGRIFPSRRESAIVRP
jgi:hypothetical protein